MTLRVDIVDSAAGLDRLLPLIADYQRFYGNELPDDSLNRTFFSQFLSPSDRGMMLAASADREPSGVVGYACLYWTFSSTRAAHVVLLNDLYVSPKHRGGGVGRRLIDEALRVARDRGARTLSWRTAQENQTAQRLYDALGAEKSVWIEYDLRSDG